MGQGGILHIFQFFYLQSFLLLSCLSCFKHPSLLSRDFPSTFFCSIYFLLCLLVSCFQIVPLTSSCGAGRREIRRLVGRRVQGISPCVPSFYTVSQLGELRNLPITAESKYKEIYCINSVQSSLKSYYLWVTLYVTVKEIRKSEFGGIITVHFLCE